MKITYKIHRHMVCLSTQGIVPYNVILETLKQALDEARKTSPPPTAALWDLLFDIRESTATRTADELRGIAMALAQYSDILSGRMALVAADPVRFRVGYDFSMFAEQLGHEPRVFGELTEAEDWLAAD